MPVSKEDCVEFGLNFLRSQHFVDWANDEAGPKRELAVAIATVIKVAAMDISNSHQGNQDIVAQVMPDAREIRRVQHVLAALDGLGIVYKLPATVIEPGFFNKPASSTVKSLTYKPAAQAAE